MSDSGSDNEEPLKGNQFVINSDNWEMMTPQERRSEVFALFGAAVRNVELSTSTIQ